MCVVCRARNNKTVKNKFPLPRIDNLIDEVQGCSYFSSLDLQSGYHQVGAGCPKDSLQDSHQFASVQGAQSWFV